MLMKTKKLISILINILTYMKDVLILSLPCLMIVKRMILVLSILLIEHKRMF